MSDLMSALRRLRQEAIDGGATTDEIGHFAGLGLDDTEPPYGWHEDDGREEPMDVFED